MEELIGCAAGVVGPVAGEKVRQGDSAGAIAWGSSSWWARSLPPSN